ncbi:MAG: prepilin-type N-terminal cleavage/methylation domain-containing protein [Gammaproteobacteria bacterium]|nr:prepilin-type N-terminal cleavage/methylation domain-containing protein [Gammaproteobacteria bacterium]
MAKQKRTRKQGFTLIEMIIVIVILSIIAGVASRVMGAAFNSYYDNQQIVNANQQGRLAIERMIRDIHAINSTTSITTANASTFTFTDVNGNAVTYTLSGTQLTRNGVVLADGINTLTFGYYNGAGAAAGTTTAIRYVNITLNITQNSVNYTLKATISTLNYV